MDIWFIFEIMLNFFTGYYDKGVLVMERCKITENYLRGWFFIDLISSAPTSIIDLSLDHGSSGVLKSTKLLRIIRMTKYARLLRILRFLKGNKFAQSIEEKLVSEYASLGIRFAKISFMVFFLAHWIACMLFSITDDSFEN